MGSLRSSSSAAQPSHPAHGRFGDAVVRAMRGRVEWGGYSVTAGRFGVRRRLVLYPPGLDASGRTRLRLWRAYPVAASVVFCAMLFVGANWSALAVGVAVLGLAALVLAGEAGDARRHVVTIDAMQPFDPSDTPSATRYQGAECIAHVMLIADSLRDAGEIDEIEHQRRWHLAYDAAQVLRASCIPPHGLPT